MPDVFRSRDSTANTTSTGFQRITSNDAYHIDGSGGPTFAFAAVAIAKGLGGATVAGSFVMTYYPGSSVSGIGSTSVPVNAGTYTVVAKLTSSNSNYADASSAPITFTIWKATPTVVVTATGGPYTGNPYFATATATGVGGVTVSGSFIFRYFTGTTASGTSSSTAPKNAGTYTAIAKIVSSDPNYADTLGPPLTFNIV